MSNGDQQIAVVNQETPVVVAPYISIPTLTAASGTFNAHVDNWPTVQSVNVLSQPPIQADVTFPGTLPVTVASGTSNINVGNFPTVQEVFVTNSTSNQVTQGTTPWITQVAPGLTTAISGTINSVISASGLQNVHVDNWPTTQGVNVEAGSIGVTNFPATQATTIASGTSNVNVGNFPTVQTVYVANQSSNSANVAVTNTPSVTIASGTSSINVGNFPTTQEVYVVNQSSNSANVNVTNASIPVTQGTSPWIIAPQPGTTLAVSGTVTSASGTQSVHVDNWPSIQGVNVETGQLAVTNFPATQATTIASGTSNVNIGNFPTVQEVYVTNSTSSQVTQGTTPWLVANNPGQTLAVSGIVTSASGTQNVHVDNWPSTQGVAVDNFPATQAVTIASGTSNINIGNFPTVSEVYVVNQSSSAANVAVTNTPSVNQGTTPWLVSNNPGQTIAVSGVVQLTNTVLSGVLSGNILVGNIPGQTVAVSGIVTAASGTLNAHIDNWPSTQGVYVVNQASNAANVAVTNTPSVTIASGTSNINVGNFPTIQEVYVVNQSSNSANVNVTNASLAVTQGTIPWLVANNPGQTLAVSGTVTASSGTLNVHVDNWPSTQGVFVDNTVNVVATAISGAQNVHVDNWPSVQGVNVEAGNIAVSNFPTTQAVTIASGTSNINIGNFPTVSEVYVVNQASNSANVNVTNASIPVTQGTTPWLVANNPGQTLAVSGIITSVSGTANVHVDNWPTVQGVFVEGTVLQTTSGTANVQYIATGQGRQLQFAPINISAAGVTQLVAPLAGFATKVVGYTLVSSGNVNTQFFNGTTALTGVMPILAGAGISANGQVSSHLFQTSTNTALNLTSSGAGITGHFSYFQE